MTAPHQAPGDRQPADSNVTAIADALARLRWRPTITGDRRDRHEHHDHREHRDHHRGRGRRGGPALWRLLTHLAASGEPHGVSEIAEFIGVDQPRASRLIAQAVDLGLVAREIDPADARRTRIVLTPEGREWAERVRGSRSEAVERALAGFSEAERRQLAELLGRLAEAWPGTGR